MSELPELHVANRAAWRTWLSKNHDRVANGVWLVFYRKGTGKDALSYDDAVEEALCYGWIDSIIRRLDEEKYCRKFTPRKPKSKWSDSNKKRVARLIRDGAMTGHGRALIDAAKKSGMWDADARPHISFEPPEAFAKALRSNRKAKTFFEGLPPSARKQFIGWIATAKREDTREKRIRESMVLLQSGKRLGLK